MEHFYRTIQGWFDWEQVYSAFVQMAPTDRASVFVELGAWKGRSTAFLATEIANSNKEIKFHVVDGWDGRGHTNPDGTAEYFAYELDIKAGLFETFTENLESVAAHYVPLRMDTVEAAAQFEDGSVDMVWIDTTQDYDMFMAELQAWLPKVRPGGWIAGHDYSSAAQTIGAAVHETFGNNYKVHAGCWLHCVNGDSTSIDSVLVTTTPFSQAVGPDQSDAYLRSKYAALATPPVQNGVTLDRPEYISSKYAVKF